MAESVKPDMQGKRLYFVKGHPRPAVAPDSAPYIRRHPDGSPMVAASSRDTLEACQARHARGGRGKAAAETETDGEQVATETETAAPRGRRGRG